MKKILAMVLLGGVVALVNGCGGTPTKTATTKAASKADSKKPADTTKPDTKKPGDTTKKPGDTTPPKVEDKPKDK